ncbi:MAG: hypothetical protein COV74_10510 [Candidatus Omnitrophica bacterium CG11_big_fil_rev_8_21_14_0_20_45_26]|uniref:SHSP domain-containing protein n=1 Tax=Candidatus Abzuiibacterium crystallinum TaxID=1974748 RepID=A0A2H0LKS0_9BACT|nr:MAG: hypothetical protein COV74_10510 [Candidatus Omnitrophica bacterium CG11_big_fil_rev_8_21_14_0_20_45_26]PIW63902.1 MAG: hypothetical protein COW12_08305 [Candidatus Omnitrophica bacterium CG12_big_fil_rev_8_21_14_0_65_45_16]
MNLIKRNQNTWDPFDVLEDLQTDLNRMFNRTLTTKGQDWALAFQPNIEIHEEPDHYALQADLPGFKKEDFNISVEGSRLTISGERKHERETKKKGYFYSERSYGSFARSWDFPTEIQSDKIKATYHDGVLDIQLPKSESAKPKQINVEVK